MLDETGKLRAVCWSEFFPSLRLFQAFHHAMAFWPALFALAGVLLTALAGSLLDSAWRAAGGGVVVVAETGPLSEIDAFTILDSDGFRAWRAASQPVGAQVAGPFATVFQHSARSLSSALQGVVAGRIFPDGAGPSLASGVAAFGRGLTWWFTQRPLHALLTFVALVAIFAVVGAAISRWVVLRVARGANIGPGEAFAFVRDRYSSLVSVWLVPVGGALAGAGLIIAGGLLAGMLAQVPYLAVLSNAISGLFFPLVILGALAITGLIVLLVFGGQMMWPAIAAEGSDAFDAWQRIPGYLFPRAWTVAFYWLILMLAGSLWWLTIRAFAVVLFKIANATLGAGVSAFGAWSSAKNTDLAKFDALWAMPAWSELPLIPSPGGASFWGRFAQTELSGSEWVYSALIAFWVLLLVALVIAYAVSFWFAAATHMYLLLRQSVDGVDYGEAYVSDDSECADSDAPVAPPAAAAADAPSAPN